MQRIPFPDDVNPDPDASYSRNTRYTPAVEHAPPTIWPLLFVCALAVVLALLTGCTGADASEQPSAAQLHAKQEQRRAIAAAQMCGPGKVAIWQDSTQVQCLREVSQ